MYWYVYRLTAYLFNTGHGVGYAFEIHNSGFAKAMQKSTKNIIEYLIYTKSGAVLGYGSYIAMIPELKFGKIFFFFTFIFCNLKIRFVLIRFVI